MNQSKRGGDSLEPRQRGWASWLLALVMLSAPLFATPAHGQRLSPEEIAAHAAATAELPGVPSDYVSEVRGEVRWDFPEQAREVVDELRAEHATEWPRVVAELGGGISDRLHIRIGRNPEEMHALAPRHAPPPAYAAGVAYPARGLILLTLTAPQTWERPDVETVLAHELSHVALHRAVAGHPIPRWFSEGVAIHQAREQNVERIRALWGGTVGGRLMSLDHLAGAFPDHHNGVNLAYAQSADFVRWLLSREEGEAQFIQLIERLGEGVPFDVAVDRTYSAPLALLESRWHDDLSERFRALPLLVGSGGLWALASLLVVVAWARRKHQAKARFSEWEREEEVEADERARAELVLSELSPSLARPDSAADDERELIFVLPPEPRGAESGIPTVEHDGRSHTLH